MIEGEGHLYYAAVQVFYAARWVQGKVVLDHSDLFMVASPWARVQWVDFGVAPDRVKLAPYPIELESLEQVPPAATDGEVTFLWLGRSVPRKRLDLFMAAFELLRKRRPGVRARFVGQVDQDAYARRMLSEYENDPGFSVCAPVSRSDVPALFASSHVLVQPSENENFGFSLAEALAAGRPIVAGPSNGTAAFGGDALFSFARYEAASVAEAMERAADAIARDPLSIGDAARRAARKHFDPRSVAANVLELGRLAGELRASGSRASGSR
jgi:glycosyltransferase involved in cell wall biosynthesis